VFPAGSTVRPAGNATGFPKRTAHATVAWASGLSKTAG
jgi:hypothetical protein